MAGVLIPLNGVDVEHHLYAAETVVYEETVTLDSGAVETVLRLASNRTDGIVRDEDGVTVLQPRDPATKDPVTLSTNSIGRTRPVLLPLVLAATYDFGYGPQRVVSADLDDIAEVITDLTTRAENAEARATAAEISAGRSYDAVVALANQVGTGTPSTGSSNSNVFRNRWLGSAWEYPTLESAQTAGMKATDTVVHYGAPRGTNPPSWRREGLDIVMVAGAAPA